MTLLLSTLVCQETAEKFKIYAELLQQWNRRTSLVQQDTLSDVNNRHILDSLQLIPIIEIKVSSFSSIIPPPNELEILAPQNGKHLDESSAVKDTTSFIDVGTGAGFPGMVLAMCGFKKVTLCESNKRKCFFLEEVARQTNTQVTIVNDRIENVTSKYDVMLSRACMDLNRLCEIMNIILPTTGYGLFHKGRSWQEEIAVAQSQWRFDYCPFRSMTSEDGVILLVHSHGKLSTATRNEPHS